VLGGAFPRTRRPRVDGGARSRRGTPRAETASLAIITSGSHGTGPRPPRARPRSWPISSRRPASARAPLSRGTFPRHDRQRGWRWRRLLARIEPRPIYLVTRHFTWSAPSSSSATLLGFAWQVQAVAAETPTTISSERTRRRRSLQETFAFFEAFARRHGRVDRISRKAGPLTRRTDASGGSHVLCHRLATRPENAEALLSGARDRDHRRFPPKSCRPAHTWRSSYRIVVG